MENGIILQWPNIIESEPSPDVGNLRDSSTNRDLNNVSWLWRLLVAADGIGNALI